MKFIEVVILVIEILAKVYYLIIYLLAIFDIVYNNVAA